MKWGQWIKPIITGLLLWALFAKVRWTSLAETFGKADLRGMPLILSLSVLMIVLRTYKWYALLRQSAPEVRFKDAWISFMGGTSLGILTPARLGELGRIFFLKVRDKARAGELMVVDRLFDLAVIFLFGSLGAAAVKERAWAVLAGSLALLIFYMVLRPQQFRWIFNRVAALPLVRRLVPPVNVSERSIGWPMFFFQLGITTINFVLDMVSFYLLLMAFEVVAWRPVIFAFPLILLSNLLPITLGGVGVREGTALMLLAMFGISPAAAVEASFLLYFLNTLLPGLFGALVVMRRA